MSPGPEDQWRPPEPPGQKSRPGAPKTSGRPRWLPLVIVALAILALLAWQSTTGTTTPRAHIEYSEFMQMANDGHVQSITYESSSGHITGVLKKGAPAIDGKTNFVTTTKPDGIPESDLAQLNAAKVDVNYKPKPSNLVGTIVSFALVIGLIGALWWFIARRAQGQMGAVMNIGRSRAKVYNTDKPKTTFADVAGYGAVKEEITEVVDFLKVPGKFKDIGARIPKGVLLVGPPGTGKTLIARAVAGEAGVPFISITGSDFMEMFVGVGAARVRDLFQTARKQAPAIIFVDEIDSIGRKRGAGLGGGHDEREQTLNQMLSEMDGFEATEGIVMLAATNRPDILDSALLRPGRFDRQIMVPLPTQEERIEILKVHFRDKKIDPDVGVEVIARGTPGMSGADLSNLVNEAALFAVRRGAQEVHKEDFDAARDRVLMGLRRESLALSEEEKEIVAYHEGGHAVCAYVLEFADPLHKVTILPTGMALGVTQQLPLEERHIYKREYIVDSLVVRLGGRVAEEIIFGHQSTGAENDLVGSTELARKMVREWGMSSRVGPMAWGSQGQVFLGEDLMHSRDYSDETARVIDEEVEHILRDEEDRCRKTLEEYRPGLDAVAKALLEHETLEGLEVAKLVDTAMGRKVGGPRMILHADGTEEPAAEALDDPLLTPPDL
jgi:cell division protease FtsH